MSTSNLISLSVLAAGVSSFVLIFGDVLSFALAFNIADLTGTTGPVAASVYFAIFALYLFGWILLLFGLVGLYVYQAEAMGVLGLIGFVVAFLGTALLAGASWALFSLLPGTTLRAPGFIGIPPSSLFATTFALAALGWALFGVDMLRVRVYPRAAAIILTIGAVISFVPILFPIPLSNIVLAVGIAWLGYSLFARERA